MPKPGVNGVGTFDVEDGRRLVRAIEEDVGWVLPQYGSCEHCVTCRVELL
jgi:hypothetical protein